MKRNNNGLLEFATKEEELAYNKKKAEFLSRTDGENAANYNDLMRQEYKNYVKNEH